MRRRRGGLNFGRNRRKFNASLFKQGAAWVVEIALVILIAYIIIQFFCFRTSVVGQAMEEGLSDGEQVFVNRFVYVVSRPKAGDVVAFLPNGNEKSHYYLRRVIATPGDTIFIKDGAVYINDKLYEEKTQVASMEDAGIASEPIELGEDEYFVLGDNRNNSEDSRFANIGLVKKEYIEGKAWYHYDGIGDLGFVH